MGSLFTYIDDTALIPCGGTQCHHCETESAPIFNFDGEIINPDLAANPQLARDEPEVSELCAECILGGNLRKDITPEIRKTINRFATDIDSALAAFGKTPSIPLFLQYNDWPMCCGDWAEFFGTPQTADESETVPQRFLYWEREPRDWTSEYALRPESLREVSLFRCTTCDRQLFTWQFT
ncbi:CbrC family protein [Novipirellula sp. SH528]|uniref:CbrC family protein n=1 Tax=Novipirellula sp. SH528 TaxID=3454466 RepID=UPI003F9F66D0